MNQLDGPAGQTSWMDMLDGPVYRPAGQTNYFYLKPLPVRIFEDFPFSLYIVAASESDKGLVSSKGICPTVFWPIPEVNFMLETSSFHRSSSFCDMRGHVSARIKIQNIVLPFTPITSAAYTPTFYCRIPPSML